MSSRKVIRYSVNVAILFWFRFTDSWRAKEIKASSTLIYFTLKKTSNWCVLNTTGYIISSADTNDVVLETADSAAS